MPLLTMSVPDSRRFDLRVLRGEVSAADARQLCTEILSNDCDLAIVRVPAGDASVPQALTRAGFPCLHADTLVVYEAKLSECGVGNPRNPRLAFRRAGRADRTMLSALVAETFSGYRSHYSANPFLTQALILDGYLEWCEGLADNLGGSIWIAEDDGQLKGFAACMEDQAARVGEGILYGVSPRHSGVGVYGDLIRHTRNDFKSRGYETMRVSTQVWNVAVQKVWAREGFAMATAKDTYHVNAMLSTGVLGYEAPIVFDSSTVEAFAQLSGDMNPIHLNESAAVSAGFPAKIAHGALCVAELSRVLGTVFPGEGTVLSQLGIRFFKPVLVDSPYRLSVRMLGARTGLRGANIVARIDEADGICMVARADVISGS